MIFHLNFNSSRVSNDQLLYLKANVPAGQREHWNAPDPLIAPLGHWMHWDAATWELNRPASHAWHEAEPFGFEHWFTNQSIIHSIDPHQQHKKKKKNTKKKNLISVLHILHFSWANSNLRGWKCQSNKLDKHHSPSWIQEHTMLTMVRLNRRVIIEWWCDFESDWSWHSEFPSKQNKTKQNKQHKQRDNTDKSHSHELQSLLELPLSIKHDESLDPNIKHQTKTKTKTKQQNKNKTKQKPTYKDSNQEQYWFVGMVLVVVIVIVIVIVIVKVIETQAVERQEQSRHWGDNTSTSISTWTTSISTS